MASTIRRSEPRHVRIAREIGISIVTGKVTPGTIMPSEITIADQKGVSRAVIREALRILSAKRLVQSRPKAGTKVCERADWYLLDPQLIGWMSESEPNPTFLHALFELRAIVEPAAAEFAALGRSARQLSLLGYWLEQMAIYGLADEVGRHANRAFHHVLFEATHNELLASLSNSINALVCLTEQLKPPKNRALPDKVSLYRDLFQAIAAADPAAARIAAVAVLVTVEAENQLGCVG